MKKLFFLLVIYCTLIARSQESHAFTEEEKNNRYYTFNIDPLFLHFQYEGILKNSYYIGFGPAVVPLQKIRLLDNSF